MMRMKEMTENLLEPFGKCVIQWIKGSTGEFWDQCGTTAVKLSHHGYYKSGNYVFHMCQIVLLAVECSCSSAKF